MDSPIQFLFDRTASSGLRSGQCLSISLSAADEYIAQSSAQLVGTFFAALQTLLPIARTARLVDGVVTRERAATFRGAPGTAALRPARRTAVPGLFLAGAWCATGWPATMEGAVRSGESAAHAVLDEGGAAWHSTPTIWRRWRRDHLRPLAQRQRRCGGHARSRRAARSTPALDEAVGG